MGEALVSAAKEIQTERKADSDAVKTEISFRNSCDREIFEDGFAYNKYDIGSDVSGKVVLDIAAHIGCVSTLASKLGAKHVYAYEAHPENYAKLVENVESTKLGDKITVSNRIVWKPGSEVLYCTPMGANTGGIRVTDENTGVSVETISLDEILDTIYKEQGEYPYLIKIDSEGSEFPILLSSKKVSEVTRIVGECHNLCPPHEHFRVEGWDGDYTIYTLAKRLKDLGFSTSYNRIDSVQTDELEEDMHDMPEMEPRYKYVETINLVTVTPETDDAKIPSSNQQNTLFWATK